MQTPRRTSVAVATVAASSLLLAACGSGGSDAGGQAAGGPVEISVGLFGSFGYEEVGLFDEYERMNPGITIRYETTQSDDVYWPALQTRLNAGEGVADIQGIDVARISDVVQNQPDLWTDLRETPAADAVDGYIDWKMAPATTDDGAVLGLGTDIGPMALCYRTDLLQQAGLPTDRDALAAEMPDWNAFIALGERFRAAAPQGSAWHDSAGGLYNAIISSQAQIYYNEAGELIHDTNPAVRSAFDMAAAAGRSGLTARYDQFEDPAWQAGFANGAFATVACPAWMVGYLKGDDAAGEGGAGKWDITPLPGGVGGNWGGAYLGIPAVSEHKEEAAALIAWLTAPEQQARVFQERGSFPSRTGAFAAIADVKDPYFNDAPIGQIFSKAAQSLPVQVLGPFDGVVKDIMTDALLSVETSGVSPADAWQAALTDIGNQAD